MVFQEQLTVSTQGHGDMHDLTEQVADILTRSQVRTGLVHIFNVGSTAAVGAIEFEPGLCKDLPAVLDGKVDLAGTLGLQAQNSYSVAGALRLNGDGTLDTSFGG